VTSVLLERPGAALKGVQQPRILSAPDFADTSGSEAIALCEQAGVFLDPWQKLVIEHGLGERADGFWAAFEVAVIVSRQNGKGEILLARQLAGLFLLDEWLILHSAHEFKTAREAFLRIKSVIENTDSLRKRCKKPATAKGHEAIETLDGRRLNFVARSAGSGRGFTGDCIILDEAYELGSAEMAAMLPTLSAVPNPQLWYASSAGMATSDQLAHVRARGVKGDPNLAYFEWSIDPSAPSDDRAGWAQANPALGIRVSEEFIEREMAALTEPEFRRERLGVWDDPRGAAVIPAEIWDPLADKSDVPPRPVGKVAFAVDSTPDRDRTSIAVAGQRPDGTPQIQVIDNRPGTGWAVQRLVELKSAYPTCAVVIDRSSAAAALIQDFADAGVEVVITSSQDMVEACGQFYDAAVESRLRHLDQTELNVALFGASKRVLEASWAWNRKNQSTDITPLVASTLALWGWTTRHASGELQIF
jgi:phage terminase large subunit-like protein